MNSKEVKVFNAYKCNRLPDPFKYHNCVVKKNDKIKDNITPLDEEIDIKTVLELDDMERATLQMFRNSRKQAEDMLDSCKRKERRYETLLMIEACNKMGINSDNVCIGGNGCCFSPIGKCAYLDGDTDCCIFCGEPEERK